MSIKAYTCQVCSSDHLVKYGRIAKGAQRYTCHRHALCKKAQTLPPFKQSLRPAHSADILASDYDTCTG